ncbi:hypothetical protein ROZALSC1DRAFT_22101 [Rozella allomycis CSF55]|uniref:Uncharacterized protein n=1 Tax=Rozella allomycis (strain CSF55) TaxID=988480 RepID=A0A4V1IZY3_ROZAC|nr:hypothetical protein ROZALSC1DRAFT_22101 [Rozella allomycis CSF55]
MGVFGQLYFYLLYVLKRIFGENIVASAEYLELNVITLIAKDPKKERDFRAKYNVQLSKRFFIVMFLAMLFIGYDMFSSVYMDGMPLESFSFSVRVYCLIAVAVAYFSAVFLHFAFKMKVIDMLECLGIVFSLSGCIIPHLYAEFFYHDGSICVISTLVASLYLYKGCDMSYMACKLGLAVSFIVRFILLLTNQNSGLQLNLVEEANIGLAYYSLLVDCYRRHIFARIKYTVPKFKELSFKEVISFKHSVKNDQVKQWEAQALMEPFNYGFFSSSFFTMSFLYFNGLCNGEV